MNNGKRDLSKIAIPNGIKEEALSSVVCQVALSTFFCSVVEIIKTEDEKLIATLSKKEYHKYLNIETLMVIDQMICETIDDNKILSKHIPGPECPVCIRLSQLNLCSTVLVSQWSSDGTFDEYTKTLAFRDKAVESGRTIN